MSVLKCLSNYFIKLAKRRCHAHGYTGTSILGSYPCYQRHLLQMCLLHACYMTYFFLSSVPFLSYSSALFVHLRFSYLSYVFFLLFLLFLSYSNYYLFVTSFLTSLFLTFFLSLCIFFIFSLCLSLFPYLIFYLRSQFPSYIPSYFLSFSLIFFHIYFRSSILVSWLSSPLIFRCLFPFTFPLCSHRVHLTPLNCSREHWNQQNLNPWLYILVDHLPRRPVNP